jgi:hypothetical protein
MSFCRNNPYIHFKTELTDMNVAMDFERVVEAYITGFKESGAYAAGIYNSEFSGARAMIYTILTTQTTCYESRYTAAELGKMHAFREGVLVEGYTESTLLTEAIEFLRSLIGR